MIKIEATMRKVKTGDAILIKRDGTAEYEEWLYLAMMVVEFIAQKYGHRASDVFEMLAEWEELKESKNG